MKLKKLRVLNGLKQNDIANILKIGQTTYSGYENGNIIPNIQTMIFLADYCNVSLDYLCDHKTDIIDTSSYNTTAKSLVKKLPKLNSGNLDKLDAFCDGLIEGQK